MAIALEEHDRAPAAREERGRRAAGRPATDHEDVALDHSRIVAVWVCSRI
jgi:hypothetical protein